MTRCPRSETSPSRRTPTDWDKARQRFIVYGERGAGLPGFYLFTRPQTFLRLSSLYPALDEAAAGVRMALTYKARDGTPIPAYLTVPSGVEAKNLPLVVLPHGGPHARDSFAFHYMAAFLPSRGYGVLQPSFRGSSGYGAAWRRAG